MCYKQSKHHIEDLGFITHQQLSIFMDLDEGFKIVSTLKFFKFELRDGVVLLNVCLLYEGDVLSASL